MTSANSQGFKVIPLQFSKNSTGYHELFIKEHSIKIKEAIKPTGRTLFVLNVPPYVNSESLKESFLIAGKVHNVILERNQESVMHNDGFQRAYIIFAKRESLLKALQLKVLNPLSSTLKPLMVGLKKQIEEYNNSIYDPLKLEKQLKEYIWTYDRGENQNKVKNVVDDEGWTVVTKGNRKPGLLRKESVQNKLNEKATKKSKKKELKNFYTFQIRESQMKNIAQLRKNFEEAKKKVTLMKQARKFKPY